MREDRDEPFDQLAAAEDGDELCRRLLSRPHGWGRSSRPTEAVELLAKVGATGRLTISCVTLLLCTCGRWRRATAELVRSAEERGLLGEADLDDLSEFFLTNGLSVLYPLAWASPQVMEIDLETWTRASRIVDRHELGEHHPRVEPPLRRWAARRALRADPAQLDHLLARSDDFPPDHRDAIVQGLLDAADRLDDGRRRTLVRRGLAASRASVRRTALDRLCDLDGPDRALRRARTDGNATVRDWRPKDPQLPFTASLFAA